MEFPIASTNIAGLHIFRIAKLSGFTFGSSIFRTARSTTASAADEARLFRASIAHLHFDLIDIFYHVIVRHDVSLGGKQSRRCLTSSARRPDRVGATGSWRELRKKNSNGSMPDCRRIGMRFDVLMLTTAGKHAGDPACGVPCSTHRASGFVSDRYWASPPACIFSGVARAIRFNPPCLSR